MILRRNTSSVNWRLTKVIGLRLPSLWYRTSIELSTLFWSSYRPQIYATICVRWRWYRLGISWLVFVFLHSAYQLIAPPGACDRGGSPADVQNYPLLLSTIRSVFDASGHSFGLTFTAPSSYWYLQNFDLPSLLESADWVNLMTYDLHGGKPWSLVDGAMCWNIPPVWDSKDAYIGPIVQAHTNLTEIKESVQLFLRVDVPLDRVALGLGFYGRSFQLSDPTCTTPGCPFSGPAPAGRESRCCIVCTMSLTSRPSVHWLAWDFVV